MHQGSWEPSRRPALRSTTHKTPHPSLFSLRLPLAQACAAAGQALPLFAWPAVSHFPCPLPCFPPPRLRRTDRSTKWPKEEPRSAVHSKIKFYLRSWFGQTLPLGPAQATGLTSHLSVPGEELCTKPASCNISWLGSCHNTGGGCRGEDN